MPSNPTLPDTPRNCSTCFHVFEPPTDGKKAVSLKCALRPPTATKAGRPATLPTARCSFWTDADTLEQPYRHLCPGEPSQREKEVVCTHAN